MTTGRRTDRAGRAPARVRRERCRSAADERAGRGGTTGAVTAVRHGTVSRVIRSRRGIRHYRPDPVPAALLRELVDLALEAPSGFNPQSRSSVVVTGEQGRKALTEATGGQPHPQEAPVTPVLVASTRS